MNINDYISVSSQRVRMFIKLPDGGPIIIMWPNNQSWSVRGKLIGNPKGSKGLQSYIGSRCPELREEYFFRTIKNYIAVNHISSWDGFKKPENQLLAGLGYSVHTRL
jgi:hypothetical protein